jgi:DHA2 family multidrug resistance protein
LRLMVSFGFICFAVSSFWSASFNTDVSFLQLIEPRLLQGVGIAFFFTPLISIVISGLPGYRIASALGLANFFRILGGSFGTSISVTMWDDRSTLHRSQLMEQINYFNPLSNEAVQQLNNVGYTGLTAYGKLTESVTQQAFMLSTNDLFWLAGWIFVGLFGIIWLTKPPFTSNTKVLVD